MVLLAMVTAGRNDSQIFICPFITMQLLVVSQFKYTTEKTASTL